MTIKYALRIARAIAELLKHEPNFEVYLPTRNGKGWIQVGVRNNAEWHEFLKTAAGVKGVTSVNYRAARADQKEQDDKDPTRQGRKEP